jgi:hypothetical protein
METKDDRNNSEQKNNNPIKEKSKAIHIGIDNHHRKNTNETNTQSNDNNKNSKITFWQRWKRDTPTNQTIAVFTVLIGMLTVPLIIASLFQAKYSRNSIEEAQKALQYNRWNDSLNTIEQKKMANNSISLSREIATTQKHFAKIETRAYIAVTQVNSIFLNTSGLSKISYMIFNSGRTPANNVNAVQIVKFGGTGIYQHEVISFEKSLGNETGIQPIIPGVPVIIETEFMKEISKNDSIEIYNNKKSLFIAGIISYTDMFGDNDTTKYCFRFAPPGGFKTITNYNIIK